VTTLNGAAISTELIPKRGTLRSPEDVIPSGSDHSQGIPYWM